MRGHERSGSVLKMGSSIHPRMKAGEPLCRGSGQASLQTPQTPREAKDQAGRLGRSAPWLGPGSVLQDKRVPFWEPPSPLPR